MKDIFKYKGNPEIGYRTGHIYMLEINGFKRPFIIAPIHVEYKSWEAFFEEWERV